MSPRLVSSAPSTLVRVDVTSGQPLYRQIYDSVRHAILLGRLAPGARLPAARVLAREIGVSRQTVVWAVDQLCAEGYLESRERSGIYVSSKLPENLLHARTTHKSKPRAKVSSARTSDTGAGSARAFRAGFPATDAFPWPLWARLSARQTRHMGAALADYASPAGYMPLRRAVAAHVAAARGVVCDAEQVVVTCGAQQALDLIARVLVRPGIEMWIENPAYPGARAAFAAAGAQLIPVPLDDQGISVKDGLALAGSAGLVYVTPSHQFPLGITMSAARRLELLSWARHAGAWVIEDDYDSEFRYASRPLASLQGLDGGERVIYVGTFSKTLFPSLRLGYLVLPTALVDAFLAQRRTMDVHAATLGQAVLAEFMADGHFARHVRRMRTLYEERRDALFQALPRHTDLIRPGSADAGMHIVGWLPDGVADTVIATRAADAGVETKPLSQYWLPSASKAGRRSGLILGFAGFAPSVIASATARLALVLKEGR